MEPLVWVAIAVYILSFCLIVRFSHKKAKYHNARTEKGSVRVWKTMGIKTNYYRIVAASSGLVTSIVISIVNALLK